MTNRIYVGNAKVIKTQYGELMKLSLNEEDVQRLQESVKGGWVNVVVKERKEPSKGGMTHYLEVDNWKPEKQEAQEVDTDTISAEDLPF